MSLYKKNGKKNINFIIGVTLTVFAFLFTLVGFFYTPYDPNEMNQLLKNQAPSLLHPFGTDNFGRDILSRVMEGAGTTFLSAFWLW